MQQPPATDPGGILVLINVRWWNATAFYAVNIARMLHKHGHRVFVGCNPGYPAYAKAQSYGLRVVPLSFGGGNIVKLVTSFARMLRIIKRHDIRIINSHRSQDHTFAVLAKGITGVKLVITRGDQRTIKKSLFSTLRYRYSDAVILTCRSILEKNRSVFDAMHDRIAVIYGSVDEDHFTTGQDVAVTAAKHGIDRGKTVVGIVGRISAVKDQKTFLRAAAAVAMATDKIQFVVAGADVFFQAEKLKAPLRPLGIEEHFRFLPHIDDIADLIGLLDIGVITSIDSETISRVLLEYMHLETAVIATDINAIGEIVRPGVTGELIAPKDAAALGRRILALSRDGDLRQRYARNGLDHYRKFYSEAVFYEQYMAVFGRIGEKAACQAG